MKSGETKGIVLYNRPYREKDRLVKIFTEGFGKRMFFVKNASKSPFRSSIQPFTHLQLLASINDDGFSFLTDVNEVQVFTRIAGDIVLNAYASYLMSLADAAISDKVYDPALYAFLAKSLELIDQGMDPEIITNIFELQVLQRFGSQIDFSSCHVCGRRDLPMDFSLRLSACLCQNHFDQDPRRLHCLPNTIYLANRFMTVEIDKIESIKLDKRLKEDLRRLIDALYEEYIGIHLKSKQFLDKMSDWLDMTLGDS